MYKSKIQGQVKADILQMKKYRLFQLKPVKKVQKKPGLFCTTSAQIIQPPCQCQQLNNKCILISRWMNLLYDANQSLKLEEVFINYRKNNKINLNYLHDCLMSDINIVSSVYQIKNESQFKVLIQCFAKHNTYYHKTPYRRNYVWLAAALNYHADICSSFWVMDALVDILQLHQWQQKLQMHAQKIYNKAALYFPRYIKKLNLANVNLKQAIQFLISDLMFSYIPIEYVSFSFQHILKNGIQFFYKLILAYLDKRLAVIDKKKIVQKESMLICILNNDIEWPIIFCNMNSFT